MTREYPLGRKTESVTCNWIGLDKWIRDMWHTMIQEKKIGVAEMKILRWTCGHTRADIVENTVIIEQIKVTELQKGSRGRTCWN